MASQSKSGGPRDWTEADESGSAEHRPYGLREMPWPDDDPAGGESGDAPDGAVGVIKHRHPQTARCSPSRSPTAGRGGRD